MCRHRNSGEDQFQFVENIRLVQGVSRSVSTKKLRDHPFHYVQLKVHWESVDLLVALFVDLGIVSTRTKNGSGHDEVKFSEHIRDIVQDPSFVTETLKLKL